jgi:prophage regulatory protein
MKLLDCTAVGELLGLNEAHVRDRLSKRRDFPPAYRLGRALRWSQEEVEDWLEGRRVGPTVRKKNKVRSVKPAGDLAGGLPVVDL